MNSPSASSITCARCLATAPAGTARCPRCGADLAAQEATLAQADTLPGAADAVPEDKGPTSPGPPGPPDPIDPMLGRTVGHYRIVEPLGSGGMGVVYRAVDDRLRRAVAVKFLARALAVEPNARARFLREAQAASALDHPNIGTVYDVGEADGQLFLATACYDGETLAARIARGPLPPGEAIALLRQIAAGLGAAHAAGIVHRDVKPANVFVTRDGTAKILDFGLAKLEGAAEPVASEGAEGTAGDPLTRSGEVLGTVLYMAPEQLEGGVVDHRVDLWALGVTAYEMLTGARPFDGSTAMMVGSRILTSEPRPIAERRAGVPPALVHLVSRLLAKDPRQRPRSMAEVLAALDGAAGGAGVKSGGSRGRKLLALVAVLGLAGGGFAVLRQPGRRHHGASTAGGAEAIRQTVAVLGFKNLSARPDAAWLSTALAETLGTELTVGDALRAIPGENVARMKIELGLADTDSLAGDTLARIRKNLGPDLVLLGSYLASGDGTDGRLRIDLRLQRTSDGTMVASLSETGTAGELPDLVARVGGRLRERLGVGALSPTEADVARRALPRQPAAERAYAEGLARMRVFDYRAARDLFERAIAVEPDHPMLHSALAEADFELNDDDKARAEARRAFELSAGLRKEDRLLVEARFRRVSRDYARVVEITRTLFETYPDNLEHGLSLALAQDVAGDQAGALATVAALRRLPAPSGDDPRIDIAEARAEPADERRRAQLAATAAAKARAAGATVVVAYARRIEGWAHLHLAEPDRAMEAADEARALFEKAGIAWGVADTLLLAASVDEQRGDPSGEQKGLERRLAYAKAHGDRATEIETLLRISEVDARQGRFREAAAHLGAARSVAEAAGDRRWLAHAKRWEATIAERHGDLGTAEEACGEAFALYQALGESQPVAARPATDSILGRVRYAQGRLGEARQRLEEALGWADAHAPEWLPTRRRALAEVALAEGNAADAERLARKATEADGWTAPLSRAESRLALAQALVALDRPADARAALDEAVKLATPADPARPGGYLDERLRVATGLARLRAALDPATPALVDEAKRTIAAAADEAHRLELAGEELEARLALAELEAAAHSPDAPRDLAAVAAQASARGFGRIARRAGPGEESPDGG